MIERPLTVSDQLTLQWDGVPFHQVEEIIGLRNVETFFISPAGWWRQIPLVPGVLVRFHPL
jgi:hypothetical protein